MADSTQYARYTGFVGGGAASGVTSLNTLTGDLTLAAGTGISITPSGGNTLTIASTSAGDLTLTNVGSSPNSKGASLSGQALTLQPANTSFPGVLLAADWNTFNGKQNALTIGNLTDAGTDGITITGGTGSVIGSGTSISQHVADSTHNGYLSSTDWSTFNSKQSALALTNLTDAGTDGITITNGTSAVVGASPVTISQRAADTTHNGYLSSADWNTFNGKTSGGITALTADVTASGPGSAAASLVATTNATLTTLSALTTASSLASVGTITSGTWSATTIAINKGGTGQTTALAAFNALSPMTTGGDLIYGGSSGSALRLANGTSGQALTSGGGTAAPTWSKPWVLGQNEIYLTVINGHGSTATKIQRYTNIITNAGSAMTYADSATNGASVTMNVSGMVIVTVNAWRGAGTAAFGVSRNSASLTTSIASLTVANGNEGALFTAAAGSPISGTWAFYAAAGDIIRPQDDGTCDGNDPSFSMFRITMVGQ